MERSSTTSAEYLPKHKSLRQHPVPEWFHDAKFGIFIHWNLSSVPGWAPLSGSITDVIKKNGWKYWFANNMYADWYLNSMKIKDSPTQRYHAETYGADFSYDEFAPIFDQAVQKWNPDEWADLFQEIGARYVVLTTKHHDGFLLWPSEFPNPRKKDYFSKRDLVGELTRAVKNRGLKMGFYYSGGLDWTFNEKALVGPIQAIRSIPNTREYADYVDRHWHELITRYMPSILWNDIGYPGRAKLFKLYADFYNLIPEGVINNRWGQGLTSRIFNGLTIIKRINNIVLNFTHFDFITPEYMTLRNILEQKWETCRGIGYSFGYNRLEDENTDHLLTLKELVDMFADLVSKNGNLLLNIGPRADGVIPEPQVKLLKGFGEWLNVNSEAIFDSRPWTTAVGNANGGKIRVRFTMKKEEDALFAILLDKPAGNRVIIESLVPQENTRIYMLGRQEHLNWERNGKDLAVILPGELPESPAYSLKITPMPDQD